MTIIALLCKSQFNHKVFFQYFFHHRNNLDISAVIREVYRLLDATPTDIHPDNMLDAFVALTKGNIQCLINIPSSLWTIRHKNEKEYGMMNWIT